jgi:predicted dehydrogenase
MLRLAVIGLGQRAASVIRAMKDADGSVHVAGVADPNKTMASKRATDLGDDEAKIVDSADVLLQGASQFDGALIGTRCKDHTEMAGKVARTDLPLYLEKPVAITWEQAKRLGQAYAGKENRVLVSYPLRASPLFAAAHRVIQSGRLGTINQVQAINNVPYGGCYFGGWHRNYDDAGGLWLQKATHDFDYITHLLNARPLSIAAATAQTVYGGEMDHDLHCGVCDRVDECVESHKNQRLRADAGMSSNHGNAPQDKLGVNHWCPFSREIKNQDAGSAIVLYDSGAHASYSQNFVSRRAAAKRGAVVTGHDATLEFDWYSEQLRVFEHFADVVETTTVKPTSGHAGGDGVLVRNFIDMMRGESPPLANLGDGLLSAAMCLAARESAYSHTFESVPLPWTDESEVPTPRRSSEVPVS